MYLPSSQLSHKPTTAQIRAAIWEAGNLAAGRSSTGKPGSPLSDEERAPLLADIAKMEAMLPAAELRELNPPRARAGRLSPAARRGLRRHRRTHTSRVAVTRTGSAYVVVGTGANEAHSTASTALRLALQPRRRERRAARVAASAVPLEEWNRLYVASRAEE